MLRHFNAIKTNEDVNFRNIGRIVHECVSYSHVCIIATTTVADEQKTNSSFEQLMSIDDDVDTLPTGSKDVRTVNPALTSVMRARHGSGTHPFGKHTLGCLQHDYAPAPPNRRSSTIVLCTKVKKRKRMDNRWCLE